jgi:hypothetical protein
MIVIVAIVSICSLFISLIALTVVLRNEINRHEFETEIRRFVGAERMTEFELKMSEQRLSRR